MELITDYAINPDGELFRVRGSVSHGYLDTFVDGNELGEERLYDEVSSGQFDFYDNGILYDNKFSGSYKIAKALGIYKNKNKVWCYDAVRDRFDWAVQMNDYRIKLEALGFPVKHMFIEAVVRDGSTYMAKNRGIYKNAYLIEINRISDHWVRAYMKTKAQRLLAALEANSVPPLCNYRERWAGRKCKDYCNVRHRCLELKNKGE